MFDKILIANRGEIACRIIRTCRRMGIRTVAVYSEADANAQHVRLADEALPIGGARPQDSYLRADAVIEAAWQSGAQAIHPGYGFLSENADFAKSVESSGLIFIGPSASSMRKMGSKAGAKDLMAASGVPVVPGYTGEDQDATRLQNEANRIGYPLMIKAAHGGGGKGMRIVHSASEFPQALDSCRREATNAFGRDRVLLERYLKQPRHIEFQIFADNHGNTIHLGERECSAQRRYQKVLEESPSPFLTSALREQMGAAAVQAARAIDYRNAGTVEFIVAANGDFYFMEINTRLQVEHPVTEMVTGLDLVEWQLRVAAGEPLPFAQDDISHSGHAIEVRLYAEDPENGFLPGSGRLDRLRLPNVSEHTRLDAGVVEGDVVSIFYDPMIAKLIVHDQDRPRALARLRDALAECEIVGPKSNIEFLERLVRHRSVIEGSIDTSYLDQHFADVFPPATAPSAQIFAAAACACLLHDEHAVRALARRSTDPYSPWAIADGWRLGHAGQRELSLGWRQQRQLVIAHGAIGDYQLDVSGNTLSVVAGKLERGYFTARIAGEARRWRCHVDATRVFLHDGEQRWTLARLPVYHAENIGTGDGGNRLLAPMPGRIVLMHANVDDIVVSGQELAVMEAMKMEISLKAPRAGRIVTVQAKPGDFVEADAVLVRMEDA